MRFSSGLLVLQFGFEGVTTSLREVLQHSRDVSVEALSWYHAYDVFEILNERSALFWQFKLRSASDAMLQHRLPRFYTKILHSAFTCHEPSASPIL